MAKKSTAAFGPLLMATWEKATQQSFEIKCGTGEEGRRKAVNLRYQLYMLRTAMAREKHSLYPATERVTWRLRVIAGEHILYADLGGDGDIEDILKGAGINLPDAPTLD